MTSDIQIIGSYLSPYVRKVLVALDYKGIPYQIDPIVPFYGDKRFTSISPVRRIPVLIDVKQSIVVNDSTVILEYLEEQFPAVSLYPTNPAGRARARWFEEFADSRLGDIFIWKIFNQNIRRYVWNLSIDEAALKEATKVELPAIMDYLESESPDSGYLVGELTIADIAVAAFFRNLQFTRVTLDKSRWPRITSLIERVLALDAFQRLSVYEEVSLRVPVTEVRGALAQTDAPLTDNSYGTNLPVKGPMTRL